MENKKTNLLTFETVLKLVRFSVWGKKADFSADEGTEESIKATLALARRHGVFTLVADAAFKCGLIDSSTKFGNAIRKIQVKKIIKIQKTEFQLSRLTEALTMAKIPHIPLKGSVIRKFYPEGFMRSSCDVDVLVAPVDLEKTVKLLPEVLGYKYWGRTFHDVSFESADGIHIEMHYDLIEEKAQHNLATVLREVWGCSEPDGNGYTYIMSNEMFMLYHIAHMAKHMLVGGCGIRPFIDLKLLFDKLKFDQAVFNEMLKRSSLQKFAQECQKMCDIWFGNGEHTELTERFQTYILGGSIYGSAKYHIAVKRSEGVGHFKHVFRLAFLPKKNLELVYPNLKKRPYLFPIYQIKRWCRVFNRAKRNKITRNIDISNNISNETVENVSALISDLGLK